MLRLLAISLASALVSIYLYQTGYSIQFIAFFWAIFYGFAALVALPMAALTAWIGPKHGILWANIFFIPSMISFALLPVFGAWLLAVVVLFQATSSVLYVISYTTDFSKIKSIDHAGKELGYMNMIEKVTLGVSPLVGGIIAFLLGPQIVLVLAAFIFLIAAVPLMKTAEPTERYQKLKFSGFPWHLIRKTAAAKFAFGFDVFTSGNAWMLFVAITIIGVQATNEVYAINGILLSVVVFAALGASYVYGRLIDRRRGWELLQVAVVVNALTHLTRPFIGTTVAVAGLNAINEVATSGYAMSYHRGIFDNADLSGRRVLYIGIGQVISCLGAAVAALALGLLTMIFEEGRSLQLLFVLTAGVVLLILTARFPLYHK
jgi:MFS family permease